MAAWVYVFDHPYFAVADQSGRFRIEKVPPGRYRIAVRQPVGRLRRDLAIDVASGQSARITVRFSSADLGMSLR